MAKRTPVRRGRPPKGQVSKLSAVLTFANNPPRNWEQLTARERKDRVCRAVGINEPYLQQLITKNEELKDFFGIVRRRHREQVRPRMPELVKQAKSLELNDLVAFSKTLRLEIKRRIDLAQAEINAE